MDARFPTPPLSADDLLVLLAVARNGRFTTAGQQLGLNHTTVARRISALETQLAGRVLSRADGVWELTPLGSRALAAAEEVERAVGGLNASSGARIEGLIRLSATDGFSGFVAAPAMAALQRRHPDVSLEIVTATRQASQQRAGADLEVVVGRPQVRRARAIHLADYALGLYASRDFLRRHPVPSSPADLAGQPLVYFIESMLHVDSLDEARRVVPGMTDAVASTNVYVHVDATRGGAGFGLLPAFLADQHDDLVRVLPDEVEQRLPYWLVARPDALGQPAVAAFLEALQERLDAVRRRLLGER
ncbi:MAG: LysR family transcriptional regulator [Microbacterium sp.]|nr:LysR family transcriptional regulator [Microbacterium sp.]